MNPSISIIDQSDASSSEESLLSLLCSMLNTSNLAAINHNTDGRLICAPSCDETFKQYLYNNTQLLLSASRSLSEEQTSKTQGHPLATMHARFYDVSGDVAAQLDSTPYLISVQLERANQIKYDFVASLSCDPDLLNIGKMIDDWCVAFHEVTSSQSQSQSLSMQQDLYEQALNHTFDCIYIRDDRKQLVYQNKAARDLSQSLDTSKHTQAKAEQALITMLEQAQSQEGSNNALCTIDLHDGHQLTLQSHIRSFCLVGNKRYTLITAKDVSEREVIINDLMRSNKDLDNFAYIASHDLKAPLNVIKRLVSWVMEDCKGVLPKDSFEDLELVMSRANRMEQLLHDLLAYSRIGKDYIEPKELNVKEKVQELLSLIDLPMGFSMKCDNSFVLVPEVPFGVVLLNLISNAIKHHDSGNAKIQIKVRRNQKANVITVIDNGPGIPEENTQKIFELFETLKPRDEVEGSGMGLSVVKRLVEHYGGYIKVDANKPRGTKFIVHWPFENIARKVLTQLQK